MRKLEGSQNKIHHLGEGWEPHVDEIDGKLVYSIPVESSFVTLSFEFEIARADLEVLKADPAKGKLLMRPFIRKFKIHSGQTYPKKKSGNTQSLNLKLLRNASSTSNYSSRVGSSGLIGFSGGTWVSSIILIPGSSRPSIFGFGGATGATGATGFVVTSSLISGTTFSTFNSASSWLP